MNLVKVRDLINQLQKSIECSICLDALNDPVETKCGHTFCGKCLQTALNQKSVLPCPLCKRAIRKRGVKNALYLSSVVASVKNIKRSYNNLHLSSTECASSSSIVDGVKSTCQSNQPLEKSRQLGINTPKSKQQKIVSKGQTPDLLDVIDHLENEQQNLKANEGNFERHTENRKRKLPEKESIVDDSDEVNGKNVFEEPVVYGNLRRKKIICDSKAKNKCVKFSEKTSKNASLTDNILDKTEPEKEKGSEDKSLGEAGARGVEQPAAALSKSSKPETKKTLAAKKLVIRKTPRRNSKRSKGAKISHLEKPKDIQITKHGEKENFTENEQHLDEESSGRVLRQTVKDKVTNWLENVLPTIQDDEDDSNVCHNVESNESDFEDLVSASQQHFTNSNYRKRKQLVSESILKDLKAKDAKRKAEIFGLKSKQQYQPKNPKDSQFYSVTSPQHDQSNLQVTPKKSKDQKKSPKLKKGKKKHIFDIAGLSQGVSPFPSPVKASEHVSISSSHSAVGVNAMPTTSPSKPGEDAFYQPSNATPCKSKEHSMQCCPVTSLETVGNQNQKKLNSPTAQAANGSPKQIPVEKCNSIDTTTSSVPSIDTSQKKNDSSQDSKTTLSFSNKVTTVTAMVHAEPADKNERKSAPIFKTPVRSKPLPANTPPNVYARCGFLQLEDMPIVCVKETQDDSEHPPAYYVETPQRAESSVLPKNDESVCKESGVKQKSPKSKHSVELGLLEFSEPSPVKDRSEFEAPRVGKSAYQLLNIDTRKSLTTEDDQDKVKNTVEDTKIVDKSSKRSIPCHEKLDATPKEARETFGHSERPLTDGQQPCVVDKQSCDSSLEDPSTEITKLSTIQSQKGNAYDSVSSNMSSIETNIIENTEEVYDNRHKSISGLSRNISGGCKEEKDSTNQNISQSHTFIDTNVSEESRALSTKIVNDNDDTVIGGNSRTKDSLIIHHAGKQIDAETNEATVTQHLENSTPSASNIPVSVSATWPKADNRFKFSATTFPLIHTTKVLEEPPINHNQETDLDSHPAEENCMNDIIPSSPLLFALSQSQKVPRDGLCDKCGKLQTADKEVQTEEQAFHSSTQTPSSSLKEIFLLIEKIKSLSKSMEAESCALPSKIEDLECLVEHMMDDREKCSDMKVRRKGRNRVLSSSSENFKSDSSPQKSDVEIENSLPQLNRRSDVRRSRASSKKRNLDVELVATAKPASRSPNEVADPSSQFSCTSSNVSASEKITTNVSLCAHDASTNVTDESDFIQTTSRFTRRKRVLSSSDEELVQQNFTKKSKALDQCAMSPTDDQTKQMVIDNSNLSFDANNTLNDQSNDVIVIENNNNQNLRLVANQAPSIHGDYDCVEVFPSRDSDVAISETPPLTDSQVPPPTPPPQHPTSSYKQPSVISDLLKSISEITKSKENVADDVDFKIVDGVDNQSAKEKDGNPDVVIVVYPSLEMKPPHEMVIQTGSLIQTPTKAPLSPFSKCPSTTREERNLETSADKLQDKTNICSNPSTGLNVGHISALQGNETSSERKFGVMVSGLRGKAIGLVKIFAKKWDGEFCDTFVAGKVTHAVVRTQDMRCDRTLKYLQAVASKAWVVSISWVTHSLKEKKLMPEDRYEVIGDNLETSDALSFGPKRSRLSLPQFCLLSGYAVHCIPPFALFTEAQFIELLQLCGARVLSQVEDFIQCSPEEKRIITVDPDSYTDVLPNYADIAQKYSADAVSCLWVLDCIATFHLQPTVNFPVEDYDSEVL